MIKSKDELIAAIKKKIGDSTEDADISLLEDVSDTFEDFETKSKDTTDWKTKYEENDKAWKKKYIDRFEKGSDENVEPDTNEPEDKPKTYNYEDLFSKE